MKKEAIKAFREKADAFLETAVYNFQNKRYDLAAFETRRPVILSLNGRGLR
jgi:HEPN domain-containing protein